MLINYIMKIGNLDIDAFKVGGSDCVIYLGDAKLYPTTPTADYKYKLTFSDASVVSAECDSTSAITSADTSSYRASMIKAEIGDCVTSISNGAFSGYTSLSSVTIGSGVTTIGDYTFYNCTSLSSVTIPNSVTSIGDSAFSGCTSLPSVTIPSGVTSIGNYTFCNCTSFSSVTIPNSVTSIGDSAFSGCTSLPSVTIPSGVTSIGVCAFNYCTSLSSVTIPSGVTSIGSYAFNDCSSLSSVTIPNSVTSISNHAFDSNTQQTINMNFTSWVENGVKKFSPTVVFNSFGTTQNVKSINFMNNLTLGDWAVLYADYQWRYIVDTLHYLTLPQGITSGVSEYEVSNVCISGDLYQRAAVVVKYNNEEIPMYGEDGNQIFQDTLIEEGSEECQSSGDKIYSSWRVLQISGDTTNSSFEDIDGDVTVSIESGTFRLRGYSTSAVTSGSSNSYFVYTTNGSKINSICFIANNNTTTTQLYNCFNNIESYDVSSGNCVVTKTDTTTSSKKYVLAKYKTSLETVPNSYISLNNLSQFVVLAIGINQADDWGTAYTVGNP